MTRREVLAMTTAAAAAPQQRPRANVLIFLADDLGFRDVGYQGSQTETPHIDRLCRGGVRLDRFHSFPLCSPTRAGLLTGRHPVRFGLAYSVVRPWANYGLSTEETTIADVFRSAGYQTAITGKWHLGHTHTKLLPRSRGFDHFYGHVNGAIDYFTHFRNGARDWQRNGESVDEKGYTTDLLADEASRWITKRDRSRPFFLYVPWNAPHTPLQAPQDLIEKYAKIADARRRTYAAMVHAMDRGIGRVLDTLEREKLLDNTLILFLSDNGGPRGQGADNGELRQGKATVFEGGLRVPALLHFPSVLKPGRTDQIGTILDVLPTLAAAAGIQIQTAKPLDGMNLWESIANGKTRSRENLFFAVQAERGPKQHALRDGAWKYVRFEAAGETGPVEHLFNLDEDPNEKNDLTSKDASRVQAMRRRTTEWAALHPPAEVIVSQHPHPGWVQPSDWSQAAVR